MQDNVIPLFKISCNKHHQINKGGVAELDYEKQIDYLLHILKKLIAKSQPPKSYNSIAIDFMLEISNARKGIASKPIRVQRVGKSVLIQSSSRLFNKTQ